MAESRAEGVSVRGTTLYVFRTGLAQGVEGENHLAWEVEVGNGTDIRELDIDITPVLTGAGIVGWWKPRSA